MAEIKILVEGYANSLNCRASSTVTYIEEEGIKIIVDPGVDRAKLLASFYENELEFSDINYVFLTHYHPDHVALVGLFQNAQIIDGKEITDYQGNYQKAPQYIPDTTIKIIETPGHADGHYSLIVNDDKLGPVSIAGDAIWWWDEEDVKIESKYILKRKDEYVKQPEIVYTSRQNLINEANYIIPGHGKMFKVGK